MKLLLKNLYEKIINANQPVFSQDWFSYHIPNWSAWLNAWKNKPHLRFLEIGSYEGRATRWLLDNILTHPTVRMYCIDTFQGSMENISEDMNFIKQNFFHNIKPYKKKIRTFIDSSQKVIRNHPDIFLENSFDFIYIDGSHQACHVLEDAILSFRLLKRGGLMVFDDYEWQLYEDPKLNPKLAIDAWLACFAEQYEMIHQDWQVCIKKI
jgi:predicted O-methyltransferase YrrM